MTEPELKPCPFCGNQPEYYHYHPTGTCPQTVGFESRHDIHCRHCDIHFSDRHSKRKAIEAWNTRSNVKTWEQTIDFSPLSLGKYKKAIEFIKQYSVYIPNIDDGLIQLDAQLLLRDLGELNE